MTNLNMPWRSSKDDNEYKCDDGHAQGEANQGNCQEIEDGHGGHSEIDRKYKDESFLGDDGDDMTAMFAMMLTRTNHTICVLFCCLFYVALCLVVCVACVLGVCFMWDFVFYVWSIVEINTNQDLAHHNFYRKPVI